MSGTELSPQESQLSLPLRRSSGIFPGLEGALLEKFHQAVQRFRDHPFAMSSPESRDFLTEQETAIRMSQQAARSTAADSILFLMDLVNREKSLDQYLEQNYKNS